MADAARTISQPLPAVRGRITHNAPLAQLTWFRVGGPAEILFKPADTDDLQFFLQNFSPDMPVTILGVASNLIIRDGGVPGVVIRLGREFAGITVLADNTLHCGAGALDLNVAIAARDAGLSGLEFLSGIPGTIGGALRMNAGAYGSEIKDILVSATYIQRDGTIITVTPADMNMAYRHCGLPDDVIFLHCVLRGVPADKTNIQNKMDDIQNARASSQPIRARTGGSTFANPDGAKAWELIDRAGCRGLQLGGAQISPLHCNFMLNTGDATAHDLESLGEIVRTKVAETTGISLHWEIRRIGVSLDTGLSPHAQGTEKN